MSLQAADLSTPEIEALLRWYVDSGVDIALDEAPHDRFAEGIAEAEARRLKAEEARNAPPAAPGAAAVKPPLPGRTASLTPMRPAPLSMAPDEAAQAARALASGADSLEALRAAMEAFDGCALKRTASQMVFADGNPQARLMLVGEAPGADDDREGRPFSGAAGRLLDAMLDAIGLSRADVYLTHVAPWRPPGNRKPTAPETAICLPFAQRHIELAGPDVLVCLGDSAVQALLGQRDGILRARGKAYDYACGGRMIPAFAMLNPDFLLRQPVHKRLAWEDLRALKKALDALAPR
jgi:DNA polymerase